MTPSEEQQFRDFVLAALPGLRRSAYLLCGDRHGADDLASIAIGKVFRSWNRVSRVDEPMAYLRKMLVNAWLDERRRPWRRERSTAVLPESPAPPDPDVAQRAALFAALARLPARRRAVLVLAVPRRPERGADGRRAGLRGRHGQDPDRSRAGRPAGSVGGVGGSERKGVGMSETGVRELFLDATSDAVLGKSTVDVDAVIVRERRSATRRRVLAAGGALAAVIGLAAGIPAVVAGRDPGPAPSTGAGPAQTDTPSPLATRAEREAFALRALGEHFPGAVRRPLEYSNWDGRVSVEADVPGPPAVLLFVEALRVDASPEHPCGRPAPSSCRSYTQADGSVVMVTRVVEDG